MLHEYIAIRPRLGDESTESINPHTADQNLNVQHTQFYQALRQLPWGHIKLLIGKIKESDDALFYIYQTIENGWSRDVLDLQIKSNLHARQGKAITNFKRTLPAPQSDLAQQTIKDPYTIELKNTRFIPEYAGKLNFYLSAVDSMMKSDADNQTIGILLCRDKNKTETEFALRDINKPLGVSEFTLTEILPEELKSSLPTVEEIEAMDAWSAERGE